MWMHTHTHIYKMNQWNAGEMGDKIFMGNEYSAESIFVSSPQQFYI